MKRDQEGKESERKRSDHQLFVVALGSSAGGLEALRSVMQTLPTSGDFAYIVAQHLSPQHPSLLTELLGRETSLKVVEIRDNSPLARNCVYVTPPNADVVVGNDRLHLKVPGARGPKPNIDILLESVARCYGARSIAIILSGTGSDGSRGVRAIKAAGGYVIAQDPRSAKYPSMPDAARDTGCVDQVLGPEQIGVRLRTLTRAGLLNPAERQQQSFSETERVFEKIVQATGIDFRGYKLKTLNRRIQQRLAHHRLTRTSDYLTLLETDPEEVMRLAQSCLISVTSFFRDQEAFDSLAELIKQRFATQANEPLRVWVPGCATGEEAYSMAILLNRLLPERRFQIFGTDIDDRAINFARRAVYSSHQLRGLETSFIDQFFRRLNSGYQLSKSVRDRVVFAKHDLLRDPLFLNLDLISCRNLLIYLKLPAQEEVIRKFHFALKAEGLLFLGKSENIQAESFDGLDRRHKIFLNKALLPGEKKAAPSREWAVSLDASAGGEGADSNRTDMFRQALLSNFAPASVLVDSNFRIIDSHGNIGRYLTLKHGKPDLNLLALAPKALGASLRAQLHRARRTGMTSRGVPKPVELHSEEVMLNTAVHCLTDALAGEPLFIVSFFETAIGNARPGELPNLSDKQPADEYIRDLERELTVTRENLQSVVEELETSNEELQALNEELQSANEELQASNEELQASNEELQSANEELVTVNEELEHKSVESSMLLEDLENIHNSLDVPFLIVDPSGNLRHVNEAAEKELEISAQLMGVPVSIPGAQMLTAQIIARLQKVLTKGESVEIRVRWKRRHYRVRIRAYYSRDKHLRGGVILFHDVTDLTLQADRLKRAEVALRLVNARQEAAINALPVHIAMIDAKGTIAVVNSAWRRFARENGFPGRRAGVGANYLSICERAEGAWSDGAADVAEGLRKVISGELSSFRYDYPCHSPTEQRYFRLLVAPVSDALYRGAILMHIDITEQTQKMEALRRQATALQSAANAVFITDAVGRVDWVNEAYERLSGFASEEILGKVPDNIEVHDGEQNFTDVLKNSFESGLPWTGEITTRAKNGQYYTIQQTITPIASLNGEFSHFVVSHQDITRHKQAQERMLYMAEHDELTGLWNRKTFCDRLADAIERHKRLGGKIVVLFLDLDRFKDTNDTLGHLVGDQMLLEIGRRLKQNLRDSDVLARFGGDEFVVMLEDMGDRENVSFVVERILHSFNRPLDLGGRSLFVSASIGITMFPDDGETAEELLRNSDLAMYRAKAEGRRAYRFYDQKLESEINERVSVERELNRALGSSDLWVSFQPQWDLKTGHIVGAEALLRWEGSKRHNITMGRVVSIAEECGMILPIGQWVIRESIAQLQRWQRQGFQLKLSINLSAVQFHHQDVFAIITEALSARGLAAGAVKAEITESVLLHRSVRVKETLHALHGAGIGLILDDFGTGYSSLTYLQQFPIETVKIDSSFLNGIGKQSHDEAIVSGIVQMAHSLGLTVVAEGVETDEQLAFLKNCGCDIGQGFLLSQPIPAAEFEKFLMERQPEGPQNPPPARRQAIAGLLGR